MYSPEQIELLEEVAEMDARWQPVLRAAKEIQARVAQIVAENEAEEPPVRVCPWVRQRQIDSARGDDGGPVPPS